MPVIHTLVTSPSIPTVAGAVVADGTSNIAQLANYRFVGDATGLGERIASVVITISNRNHVPQETLGPIVIDTTSSTLFQSTWFVELLGSISGADYTYTLTWPIDVLNKSYPLDHVILHFSAVGASGRTYDLDEIVQFAGDGSLAALPGYEPYADLVYASAFFRTRIEGKQWEELAQRDQFACLCTASDDIDTEKFKGRKRFFTGSVPIQSVTPQMWERRQFPRITPEFSFASLDVEDNVDDESVPAEIRRGTCIQALYLGRRFINDGQNPDDRRDLQQAGLTAFNSGDGVTESWDLARATRDRICAAARNLIQPFLLTAAQQGFLD